MNKLIKKPISVKNMGVVHGGLLTLKSFQVLTCKTAEDMKQAACWGLERGK